MPKFDTGIIYILNGQELASLRKNTACHKCGIELKINDKIRKGGSKGRMKIWHDACFGEY